MGSIKHTIITFGKAQVSSWVASIVDFSVTILLNRFTGLWYVYSTFLGALAGGIVNCTINYKWVFQAGGIKKRKVAMRYMIVWVGSIVLNTVGTMVFNELTGFSFILVKAAVSIVVAIVWNYQLQRLFVFNQNISLHRMKSILHPHRPKRQSVSS